MGSTRNSNTDLHLPQLIPFRHDNVTISTYEKNYTCPDFNDGNFNVQNALEAADYITGKGVFADFTNPVTAAAALASGNGFELAVTRVD